MVINCIAISVGHHLSIINKTLDGTIIVGVTLASGTINNSELTGY